MILITGGTGLVGEHLAKLLLAKGYEVGILSRSELTRSDSIKTYEWDIAKGYIQKEAVEKTKHIVHLAGAGIVEKSWTKERKQALIDSRVQSAELLTKYFKDRPIHSFISASAVGYYPSSEQKIWTENDPPANDFLAQVCKVWEDSALQFDKLGVRTIIFRIGLVLAKNGGALPEMSKGMNFGLGGYFGTGKQWYSWIHIDDLCQMILFAIENNQMQGIYNAVAPYPLQSKTFSEHIIKNLKRSVLLAPVPNIVTHLLLGERKEVLLRSQNVSSEKIQKAGYTFLFGDIDTALNSFNL